MCVCDTEILCVEMPASARDLQGFKAKSFTKFEPQTDRLTHRLTDWFIELHFAANNCVVSPFTRAQRVLSYNLIWIVPWIKADYSVLPILRVPDEAYIPWMIHDYRKTAIYDYVTHILNFFWIKFKLLEKI